MKQSLEEYVSIAAPKSAILPGSGINFEVRHYRSDSDQHPVMHQCKFDSALDAMLYLMADYLYFEDTEWEKTATEIDEDRETYVVYVQPVQ